MTESSDDSDVSAVYARQRADVEASLGRVFRNACQLAPYWDGRPVEALLRRAPKGWDVAEVEEPVYEGRIPEGTAWTSKDEMLRSFLEFAKWKPVVACVLAVTAGAVAVYAMKLASEQE